MIASRKLLFSPTAPWAPIGRGRRGCNWSNELADSLGIMEDENPDDGNHITVTLKLENGLEDEPDLSFRIQEE